MNLQERHDDNLDPLLASALGELRDDLQLDVDWNELRMSINDRAALPLARRRTKRSPFARRSVGVLAAAASIAFALWAGPSLYRSTVEFNVPVVAATVDDEVLMEALTGDLTEGELIRLVYGSPEVLLTVAISPR